MRLVLPAALLTGGVICALLTPSATGSASAATSAVPPPVTILTADADSGGGDIFVSPGGGQRGGPSYAGGPEILSDTGKVIWFHPVPADQEADDFRTQTYLGKSVLTWFQGGVDGGPGSDYIYNDHYQKIATVNAGNGYQTDMHEFLITPWNTALILADATATANLTAIGGSAHQMVMDGIVQEIDIKTGKVLFQWDSASHVPYSDSHLPLPPSADVPWDWFHINAVHLDSDGNLLVSSRNTWTVYKVNRHTGAIMWRLGGKHSSFTLTAAPGQVLDSAGEIFAFQHDPEGLGHGLYTVFDDESAPGLLGHSRAVTIRLDLRTHVATLLKSVNQPEGLTAGFTGNAQTTRTGNLFVSWGNTSYFSEFSPSGKLLFNAKFADGDSSYRAYRLPWHPAS